MLRVQHQAFVFAVCAGAVYVGAQDVDECADNTHNCEQICINTMGGFECACELGYELAGGNACIDINECASNTHNCGSLLCVNTPGSFTCMAPPTPAPLVCPEDQNDDNLEVLYPPLLDERSTGVTFNGTDATFEALIRVPKQYETAKFSFEGATDPSGGFDSTNLASNIYWTIDFQADACNVVYRAAIPWDLFRTTLGGTERRNFMREVAFVAHIDIETNKTVTVIPDTLLELKEEPGNHLLQLGENHTRVVATKIPFDVTFETQINLENSIYLPSPNLRIAAAILDSSVVSVNVAPFAVRARLEFVTTIPLPLILERIDISVDDPDLGSGLTIRELTVLRDCQQNSRICTQRWEVDIFPQKCDLNGIFRADIFPACHDERQGCNETLLIESTTNFNMSITSDDFCGHVQEVNLIGELTLQPSDCNGVLQGHVSVESEIVGAYINHTEIVSVRANPPLASPDGSYVTVYDEDTSVSILNYAADTGTFNDQVNFEFDWDGAYLRCDVLAAVEVSVLVVYGATRNLTSSKLLSFRSNAKSDVALLQLDDREQSMTLGGSIPISIDADESTRGAGNGHFVNGVPSSPLAIGLIAALSLLLVAIIVGGCFYVRQVKQKEAAKAAALSEGVPTSQATTPEATA